MKSLFGEILRATKQIWWLYACLIGWYAYNIYAASNENNSKKLEVLYDRWWIAIVTWLSLTAIFIYANRYDERISRKSDVD